MSDNVSIAEAMETFREVGLRSENAGVQKHALDLLHDLTVFQELKAWSADILNSQLDTASKAEAFVHLRIVGDMVLRTTNPTKTVEEVGIATGLLPTSLINNNVHTVPNTPDLIEFTPTQDSFPKAGPSQNLPRTFRSPESNHNQLYHAAIPSPLRKALTVSQATEQAHIRRSSRDKGKEVDRQHTPSESSNDSDSNVVGLLHETPMVLDVPAEPSAAPNLPMEQKKKSNMICINGWYMNLNDEETSDYFSNVTNTIAKIMDQPTYDAKLKEALAAVQGNKHFDPTKDTPAAIKALFATDPVLANRLWGASNRDSAKAGDLQAGEDSIEPNNIQADENSTKSTTIVAPSELRIPTLQDVPKRRKVFPQMEIPQITVTDPLSEHTTPIETCGGSSSLHDLSSPPSIFDLMPGHPHDPNLALPPVPTHPQTFKYTRTVVTPFMREQFSRAPRLDLPLPMIKTKTQDDGNAQTLGNGKTQAHGNGKGHVEDEELDWDAFIPQFRAMMDANRTPTTIPQTHENPIVAAQIAMLHAQTILPRGCNNAYKEVCPCELSGRECPFKATCSLKKCYHEQFQDHAGSHKEMHPAIRPTCVAWLQGDLDCGHTNEEKQSGEFGHEDKATREWQGGDMRIRLHLVWNI